MNFCRVMSLAFFAAAIVFLGGYDALAQEGCLFPPCNPVPEMELLMVPAAMGAAGLLAYRARRKASKKNDKA